MVIVSILAFAIVSIGLILVAVTLRSRSVTMLNFMLCLIAGIVTQPWAYLSPQPPQNEEMRLYWIAALLGVFLFLCSIITWIYCLIITFEKKTAKQSRRRKRRRKGRSRGEIREEGERRDFVDVGDDDEQDDVPPDRS